MIDTWLNEGIYEFKFPYVGYYNDMGTCSIELHAGRKTGLNVNTPYQFTAIITQESTGAPALEHFIENITTHLKTWIEAHLTHEINPDAICWYQVLPYYNNGIWKKVTMQWSTKHKCFHDPKWEEMNPKTTSTTFPPEG